jgi:Leucine-rich repeat (LRR) protein
MFTTAKLTAMKRWISLPPIVWIGLVIVLGSWQPSALAETDCNAVTEIPKAQCEILIAIYDSTAGDNWTTNTGWQQTNTPCSWFGVTCANSTITRIDVRENNLVGTLPSLSALTGLTHLYLFDNQLSGSIPDLSSLTELVDLRLHTNQLTGSIPDLSALINLQFLSFGNNKLTGSVLDLSALTTLQNVRLYSNQLTGSIPDFSALTNLQFLSLGDNQLTGPIPDLSALTNLQELRLYDNQLTGSIPDELSGLTKLEILRLEENQFTGTIPNLSGLTKLTDLRLSKNQLTGPIPDVSGAQNLEYLYLQYNDLSGSIPSWISTLTKLVRLYLNDNGFTGSIPDLSALTKLEYFTVVNNELCKNPDIDYGKWANVVRNFSECAFSCDSVAEIPKAQCEDLVVLYDSTGGDNWKDNTGWKQTNKPCSWYGIICGSGMVTQIRLSDNQLIGSIPDFNALVNLLALSLVSNQLTGSLPNFNALTSLVWLFLSDNQLSGSIPNYFNTLTNLQILRIDNNTELCQNSEVDYGDLDVSAFLDCNDPNYGLIAYYPFENNANDASGNGNDGTVNGATLTTDQHGIADSAYFFNGENSWIEVPDSKTLDSPVNAVSISVWVLVDSFPIPIETSKGTLEGWHGVISKGTAESKIVNDVVSIDGHRHYSLFVSGNKHIHFAHAPSNGSQTNGYQLPSQEWVHLVVVANPENGGQNTM